MTPAARARQSRIDQGLPPTVEDDAAYAVLADLITAAAQREAGDRRDAT